MVNTGHPSKACKLCRTRRIKCDETKPHCLKCKKTDRQCPGYKDAFEIKLRDETQSTIRKATSTAPTRKRAKISREPTTTTTTTTTTTVQHLPAASSHGHRKQAPSDASSDDVWQDSPRSRWSSSQPGDVALYSTGTTWSSPSTDVSSTTPLLSPPGYFVSPTSSALELHTPTSSRDSLFDFNNATWQISAPPSPSTLGAILNSLSPIFDPAGVTFGTSTSYVPAPDQMSALELPKPSAGIQTPLDDQATCYFLSHFVQDQPAGNGQSLFNFILPFLTGGEGKIKNTPFRMAFTAVSLEALAGRPNSRQLSTQSRTYYSTALTELKDALKDKNRARDDATLASAILMSLYEALVCESANMNGWSNHLDGAKAILKLRDKDIVKTSSPEGLEMFKLVRAMAIRQYMFGFVANPAPGEIEWWGEHECSEKSGHVALLLNLKTTSIRAEADRLLTTGPKTPAKITQAMDLLRRAREIVLELGKWLDRFQPAWPRSVSGFADDVGGESLDTAAAFPGAALYGFSDMQVAAKLLNTYASRIMLAGIVVRCVEWVCGPTDHFATDDYKEAVAIGREEVANVIATVPYFVSWRGDHATTPYFPCGSASSPKAYSVVISMYPLLCTGLSYFATTRQKRWLCGRLRYMAETMGIKQAELFAQFISNSDPAIGRCS